MSKLGFDRVIRKMQSIENKFLRKGMKLAQKEFKQNFDGETNSETKENWAVLERGEPPPKLDVDGLLKANTISFGNVSFYPKKAILLIDPIDSRGRGYAAYHQDGINQYKSKKDFQREFVTQSEDLTIKQVELLENTTEDAFS